MALSPTSSHGGSTPPVTLTGTDPNAIVLEVEGATGQGVDLLRATPNPTAESYVQVDAAGTVTIFSGDARQQATLTLQDNTSGNAGQVKLDTYEGVLINPEAAGNVPLVVTPRTGHTGDILHVKAVGGGSNLLQITAAGSIVMPALPAADPHVVGQLWNNAGTLKVSAG